MLYPGLLNEVVQAGVQFYQQYNTELAEALGDDLEAYVRDLMNASMAGTFLVTGVLMTMLARSWQAGLYNPGGFRKEFHSFRLSPPVAILCVGTIGAAQWLGLNTVLLAWAAGLPLFIAGLAMVHGVIGIKGLSGNWVVMFYVALVLLGPSLMIFLVVMAFVDSWLDIRSRLKASEPVE